MTAPDTGSPAPQDDEPRDAWMTLLFQTRNSYRDLYEALRSLTGLMPMPTDRSAGDTDE